LSGGEYSLFGGQKERTKFEKLKLEVCTPYDIVTILTELKCVDKIINNRNMFYGVYKTNAKGWTNLTDVRVSDSNLPSGSNIEVKHMKISMSKCLGGIYTLFTYHIDLLPFAIKLATMMASNVNPKSILLTLEKSLPKKKFYIKSGKNKTNKDNLDPKLVSDVADYFCINNNEAISYLQLIECHEDYDEFISLFRQEKNEKSKKKGGKR